MLLPQLSVTTKESTSAVQPVQQRGQAMNEKFFNKASRYPKLLGKDWQRLPPSLKKRFVRTIPERETIIYQGRIHKTRLSKTGRLLSVLCRLIGNPLPHGGNCGGPATVVVSEARECEGQHWTRIYPSKKAFPHVIQSMKRFDGPTGLEEQISNNFGIALRLELGARSISFISDHYYLMLWGKRWRLPKMFTPGNLTVTHKEAGPRRFRYTLCLHHRLFGELIFQTGIFEEVSPC